MTKILRKYRLLAQASQAGCRFDSIRIDQHLLYYDVVIDNTYHIKSIFKFRAVDLGNTAVRIHNNLRLSR